MVNLLFRKKTNRDASPPPPAFEYLDDAVARCLIAFTIILLVYCIMKRGLIEGFVVFCFFLAVTYLLIFLFLGLCLVILFFLLYLPLSSARLFVVGCVLCWIIGYVLYRVYYFDINHLMKLVGRG